MPAAPAVDGPKRIEATFKSPVVNASVPPGRLLVPRLIVPVYGLLVPVMVQVPGVPLLSALTMAPEPTIVPPQLLLKPFVSKPT